MILSGKGILKDGHCSSPMSVVGPQQPTRQRSSIANQKFGMFSLKENVVPKGVSTMYPITAGGGAHADAIFI